MLHRVRLILDRPRTELSNAMRADLAEFGIAALIGRNGLEQLFDVITDRTDERVEAVARHLAPTAAVSMRHARAHFHQDPNCHAIAPGLPAKQRRSED